MPNPRQQARPLTASGGSLPPTARHLAPPSASPQRSNGASPDRPVMSSRVSTGGPFLMHERQPRCRNPSQPRGQSPERATESCCHGCSEAKPVEIRDLGRRLRARPHHIGACGRQSRFHFTPRASGGSRWAAADASGWPAINRANSAN